MLDFINRAAWNIAIFVVLITTLHISFLGGAIWINSIPLFFADPTGVLAAWVAVILGMGWLLGTGAIGLKLFLWLIDKSPDCKNPRYYPRRPERI